MTPVTRFAVRVLVLSAALFGVWWVLIDGYSRYGLLMDAAFMLPVIAVILASAFPTRGKLRALGVLAVLFVLGDTAALLAGLGEVSATGLPSSEAVLDQAAAALYHVFRLGLPIAVLVAVCEGDLRRLWVRID